jgi:hypothetical protein
MRLSVRISVWRPKHVPAPSPWRRQLLLPAAALGLRLSRERQEDRARGCWPPSPPRLLPACDKQPTLVC